jgi:hypothetical protein
MKKNQKPKQEKRSEKVSQAQARARAGAREANRESAKAAKTVPPQARKAPKSAKGVQKRILGLLHPESDLALWTEQLAQPFKFEGRICPVSYNPAPSFIQSTARTTSTNLNLPVSAGTTTQLAIFPGHALQAPDAILAVGGGLSMDAVSYHGMDVDTASGTFCVGPMLKTDNVSTKQPLIGLLRAGLGLGTQANIISSMSPVTWDVALPYTANTTTSGGHHSRWQLAGMGIRIRNTTPEIYRGGNVVTVQPNNSHTVVNVANQSTLEVFPTFYDHGVCESTEVSWIPRAQDLAFWHAQENISGGTVGQSILAGPGMLVFFNNSTANTISFSFEIVCHWQLAGTYLNTVGSAAPHSPETKSPIEKVVSILQNGSHTASNAVQTMKQAVEHSGFASAGSFASRALRAVGSGARSMIIP